MKIVYEYSHLGGSEILQVRYPELNKQIKDVISKVKANKIKESKEKTMKGKMLFSPKDMNDQFLKYFSEYDFHEIRDTYTITIPNSKIEIPGAFKQARVQ